MVEYCFPSGFRVGEKGVCAVRFYWGGEDDKDHSQGKGLVFALVALLWAAWEDMCSDYPQQEADGGFGNFLGYPGPLGDIVWW